MSSIAREPQPVVGPDGNVYEGRGKLSPSGSTLFSFPLDGINGPPINTMSEPETSATGAYYMVKNNYTIFSYTLNGFENWRFTEGGILFNPIASPQSDLLVLGGRVQYGEPGFFLAVGSDGLLKWRVDLPFESGNWIIPNTRARFTPDGQSAYISADIPGQVGDEYCYLYALQTAASTAASSLTSITANPVSVGGGSPSQATVTLSGPAPTGVVVSLSNSNPSAASAPASVMIPAGAISATFTVTAAPGAKVQTSATITASYGGQGASATLTISAGQTGDSVAIQQADYIRSKGVLRVQATGTNASAALNVYVTSTGQLIGMLRNNGGGKYSADLNWPSNLLNITVRSSAGGSATRAVTLK